MSIKYSSPTKKMLEQRAGELLEFASRCGGSNHYLFLTTFERYRSLLAQLEQMEQAIKASGAVIFDESKETFQAVPIQTAYIKTTAAANQTALALTKIMTELSKLAPPEQVELM